MQSTRNCWERTRHRKGGSSVLVRQNLDGFQSHPLGIGLLRFPHRQPGENGLPCSAGRGRGLECSMSSWDEAIVVTVEYWHKQAEEARVLAEQLTDELAKAMMLRVAEDCDKLADM